MRHGLGQGAGSPSSVGELDQIEDGERIMSRVPIVAASRWFRYGVWSLAATIALTAFTIDDADARSRRKRVKKYHHSQVKKAQPAAPIMAGSRYAAIVIDVKTRKVLHQSHADATRHPASLTKIMTLYLLFEQLEAGKIKLSTQMPVSEAAASQAPTKLGLKPGQTLSVEDAIKGLVTKSANDAAVVVAEALSDSEAEFARQMTRKARALGMTHTVYRNASGLPDDAQVTTARDQALLGIAIQERFPRYYRYFSTTSFVYRGRAMRNHNKLLGSVAGVDGIKTGYTRASGFNLTTSMHRGERHVVAVVLGGATGSQRDARMRQLLGAHIMEASTKRTAPTMVAAAPKPEPAAAQAVPAKPRVAAAASRPVTIKAPTREPPDSRVALQSPRLGSNEPIKPVVVKTVVVKIAPSRAADAATPPAPTTVETKPAAEVKAAADAKPAIEIKPAPEHTAALAYTTPDVPLAPAPMPPPGARPGVLGVLPSAVAAGPAVAPPAPAAEKPAERPPVRSGWAIQIGAFEDEAEAKQRLAAAKAKAGAVLKKADPYTERAVKGDKTWYRARFAGFDRDGANAACKALKRSDIACMALKI
jgi:D-alanyl-D-alanine carboxypeptidase